MLMIYRRYFIGVTLAKSNRWSHALPSSKKRNEKSTFLSDKTLAFAPYPPTTHIISLTARIPTHTSVSPFIVTPCSLIDHLLLPIAHTGLRRITLRGQSDIQTGPVYRQVYRGTRQGGTESSALQGRLTYVPIATPNSDTRQDYC